MLRLMKPPREKIGPFRTGGLGSANLGLRMQIQLGARCIRKGSQLELAMTFPVNSREFTHLGPISDADVAAARRVFQSLNGMLQETAVAPMPASALSLGKLATEIKKARELRGQIFDPELFGEPGWDMMLALFISHAEQYRLKVSDLIFESNVPSTTALRWMKTLLDQGLCRKVPNPRDSRSSYIELSDDGLTRMTALLTRIAAKRAQVIATPAL